MRPMRQDNDNRAIITYDSAINHMTENEYNHFTLWGEIDEPEAPEEPRGTIGSQMAFVRGE